MKRLLGMFLVNCFAVPVASAVPLVSIVVDNTTSMNKERTVGGTRCSAAFDYAKTAVEKVFDQNPQTLVNIQTFKGKGFSTQPRITGFPRRTGTVFGIRIRPRLARIQSMQFVSITDGFKGKQAVLNALADASNNCDGSSTPLADAICKASDTLREAANQYGTNKLELFVMTDGKENSSKSCRSPNWRSAVKSKITSNPPIALSAVIFWPDSEEIAEDFEFLKGLSLESGSSNGTALRSFTSRSRAFGVVRDSATRISPSFPFRP